MDDGSFFGTEQSVSSHAKNLERTAVYWPNCSDTVSRLPRDIPIPVALRLRSLPWDRLPLSGLMMR
jgi:hypothetical protein